MKMHFLYCEFLQILRKYSIFAAKYKMNARAKVMYKVITKHI